MTPDAWWDLSARLGAAAAVVDAISCYVPCGEHTKPVHRELNAIADLATAAAELIKLAKADCEALEALQRRP